MTELLCFHGSPGLPEDFQFLQSGSSSFTLLAGARKGYPGHQSIPKKGDGLRIVVGYSWGVRAAIEWAEEHPDSVDGFVLISPYLKLKADRRNGVLKKTLISLPFIGKWILAAAAPTAIGDFIKNSSYPSEAPEFYLAQKACLSNPKIILASILEKTEKRITFAALNRKLCTKPALIVWGIGDKTNDEAADVSPLRGFFQGHKEVKIKNSGHALVYTHPQILLEEVQKFLSERK